MADKIAELLVEIGADVKDLKKGLEEGTKSVKKFKDEATEGDKRFKEFKATLTKYALIAGGVAAAVGVTARVMTDFAVAGARAADVQEQFNRVVGAKGIAVLMEMQKATLGTVDKYTLMTSATMAASRGIDANYVPALAKLSMQMKDAGLQGAELNNIISDVSMAVNTGRLNSLIPYGVNIEDLKTKMAGATSEAEKMKIVIDALAESSSKYADPTYDAADAVDELKRAWIEFKAEVGQGKVGEVVTETLKGATALLEGDPRNEISNLSTEEYQRIGLRAYDKWAAGGMQSNMRELLKEEVRLFQESRNLLFETTSIRNEQLGIMDQELQTTAEINHFSGLNYNLENLKAEAAARKREQDAQQLLLQAGITDYTQQQLDNLIKQMETVDKMTRKYEHFISIGGGKYVKAKGDGIYQEREGGGYEQVGSSSVRLAPRMNDFIMRPGQAPAQFSPHDTVIGVKDTDKLGGKTVNVYIDSVQGLNPQAVADAFEEKVLRSITG